MPILSNRDELEAQLAKEVGKLNERTRRKLLKLIGDPPSLDNFTGDVWYEILIDFQQVLTPELETVFIAGVQNMITDIGFTGVNWDLINQRAVDWARQYGADLSGQLIDARQKALGDAMADYFANRIDRTGLFARVNRLYGAAKGEEIAITEVTRAAVAGEQVVVDQLTDEGVMLRKVWLTVRDDHVCPICEPMDGMKAEKIGFDALFIHPETNIAYDNPPAHTRCRCGVRYDYENPIQ